MSVKSILGSNYLEVSEESEQTQINARSKCRNIHGKLRPLRQPSRSKRKKVHCWWRNLLLRMHDMFYLPFASARG